MTNDILSKFDVLKQKANDLGMTFHPSIKEETLALKIENFLKTQQVEAAKVAAITTRVIDPNIKGTHIQSQAEHEAEIRNDATRMVRVHVSNMNPNKREWEGEIFTISNSLVGTLRKYVPFNNDEGWHIPFMMYKHLKERECQIFIKQKNKNGVMTARAKIIKEFNVELMDPLTPAEMQALGQRQAAANGTEAA